MGCLVSSHLFFFPLLFVITLVVTLCSFTEIFGIATKKPTSVSLNPCELYFSKHWQKTHVLILAKHFDLHTLFTVAISKSPNIRI